MRPAGLNLEELVGELQEEELYPRLVVGAAELCDYPLPAILPLAAAVQFLFWGNALHHRVGLGKVKNRLLRGSYCYATLFFLLSEGELRRCLVPLTQVVRAHCEFAFLSSGREEVAARKALALLGGESCRLPALLAGKKELEEGLYRLGLAIGRTHASLIWSGVGESFGSALAEVKHLLEALPGGSNRELLVQLVDNLDLITKPNRECSEARR
ncbi:hypothetical protein [Desulfothermobacter acidiphilus]|uniref:hypothetical protein n=1 Tax=Desulfothermobacter acidiphilus TaxID=1938353 RepID=UPI003F8CAC9E